MTYHQITSEERYILATLRTQGLNQSELASCNATAPAGMATTGPAKPSSAPRGDALVHDVINASRAVICDASTLSFVNCGAPSRSAAGCAALSPSATRRSTVTSGEIASSAARCTPVFAALASDAVNATALTTAAAVSPARNTSASGLSPPSSAPRSATGRSTP